MIMTVFYPLSQWFTKRQCLLESKEKTGEEGTTVIMEQKKILGSDLLVSNKCAGRIYQNQLLQNSGISKSLQKKIKINKPNGRLSK